MLIKSAKGYYIILSSKVQNPCISLKFIIHHCLAISDKAQEMFATPRILGIKPHLLMLRLTPGVAKSTEIEILRIRISLNFHKLIYT